MSTFQYLVSSNSMKQSPSSEADSSSATKEIPRILRKPKIYYRIHKSPTPEASVYDSHQV
jgi:hypothetical protein